MEVKKSAAECVLVNRVVLEREDGGKEMCWRCLVDDGNLNEVIVRGDRDAQR